MALRRVAIYGGTFDPVHNGHLELARRVLTLFELDEVIFVPACVPPHKRTATITSAFHRFAMLALATAPDQKLLVSTIELDAPNLPYAVETVERIKNDSTRLFFVIGADSWAEITTWRDYQRLLEMCDLIVVTRPGYSVDENAPSGARVVDLRDLDEATIRQRLAAESNRRVYVTNAAMVDVSATRIRAAAKSGDQATLQTMVPPLVAAYIEKNSLYQN